MKSFEPNKLHVPDLVAAIYPLLKEEHGVPNAKKAAASVVSLITTMLYNALSTGTSVNIKGLGTFSTVHTKPKFRYDLAQKKHIPGNPSIKIKFKACVDLKAAALLNHRAATEVDFGTDAEGGINAV